jgi:hypothetical protein
MSIVFAYCIYCSILGILGNVFLIKIPSVKISNASETLENFLFFHNLIPKSYISSHKNTFIEE